MSTFKSIASPLTNYIFNKNKSTMGSTPSKDDRSDEDVSAAERSHAARVLATQQALVNTGTVTLKDPPKSASISSNTNLVTPPSHLRLQLAPSQETNPSLESVPLVNGSTNSNNNDHARNRVAPVQLNSDLKNETVDEESDFDYKDESEQEEVEQEEEESEELDSEEEESEDEEPNDDDEDEDDEDEDDRPRTWNDYPPLQAAVEADTFNLPFNKSYNPIGIHLDKNKQSVNLLGFQIKATKDIYRCNESNNITAHEFLYRLNTLMGSSNDSDKRSPRHMIPDVMKQFMEHVSDEFPCLKDDSVTTRVMKYLYKILAGFNTFDSDYPGNMELRKLGTIFARIRLGKPGYRYNVDTFNAFVVAVSLHTMTSKQAVKDQLWLAIIVKLFNGHLVHHKLSFRVPSIDMNTKVLYDKNSCTMKRGSIYYMVEKRESVRKELVRYAKVYQDYERGSIALNEQLSMLGAHPKRKACASLTASRHRPTKKSKDLLGKAQYS